MRFKDPKTGKIYMNVLEALEAHCEKTIQELPGGCVQCQIKDPVQKYRGSPHPCSTFCTDNPIEAARLMGYEVIEENAAAPDSPSQHTRALDNTTRALPNVKSDGGKARLDLVPLAGLFPMARVREFDEQKYGHDGIEAWRNISDDRLLADLLRHTAAYQENHDAVDPESGLPAAYHIEENAMFLAIKAMERLENRNEQAEA